MNLIKQVIGTLLLSLLLTGCGVVQLLMPSDPCADKFQSELDITECRAEQTFIAAYGEIEAAALAATPGDLVTQEKLQKRKDALDALRVDQQIVADLINRGQLTDAETQLNILVKALEKISNEKR